MYLRARSSKSSKQNGILILIGVQKAPKVFKIKKKKIASLKVLLEKAKEKLKIDGVHR